MRIFWFYYLLISPEFCIVLFINFYDLEDYRMYPLVVLALISLVCVSFTSCSHDHAKAGENKSKINVEREARIERGRYLITITGCNDCHTAGYMQQGLAIPESEWLTGMGLGFKGPWGTSYPKNLRKSIARMTEKEWIEYARSANGAPPMPWVVLQKMKDSDLRDIYAFVSSLGAKGDDVPAMLPPGQIPQTPYIVFEPVFPSSK